MGGSMRKKNKLDSRELCAKAYKAVLGNTARSVVIDKVSFI